MSAARDAALAWAERGHPVLPVRPDKSPLPSHGLTEASTDAEQLRAWWRRWPEALVAVRLDDLLLIDRDSTEGEQRWQLIVADHADELLETAQAKTPRGMHDYFTVNGTRPSKGSGDLAPDLEWRCGSGHYAVVPPGPERAWLAPPSEVELASAPGWLLDLVLASGSRTSTALAEGDPIRFHHRDNTLASLAGTMRRRGMSEAALVAALQAENEGRCQPPLSRKQVEKIARSVARYEPVVVPRDPRPPGTTPHDLKRYEGRRVDLIEMLAKPTRPTPWRIFNLVADGTHTVIPGVAGSGKSWLLQAACHAVERGAPLLGWHVAEGHALYVDGEMGRQMFVDLRLRPAGMTAPSFGYLDAAGLDFSTAADLAWLEQEIEAAQANLVVIDSLRKLTPSRRENDSDDMAPTVGAISDMARRTQAAIMTTHHRSPDSEKFWRGSSAIQDQCDAMIALLREEGDLRRLCCQGGGKMRYAPEPEDRWLEVNVMDGCVKLAAPGSGAPLDADQGVRAEVKLDILSQLPRETKTDVAKGVGRTRDDRTLQERMGRAGA